MLIRLAITGWTLSSITMSLCSSVWLLCSKDLSLDRATWRTSILSWVTPFASCSIFLSRHSFLWTAKKDTDSTWICFSVLVITKTKSISSSPQIAHIFFKQNVFYLLFQSFIHYHCVYVFEFRYVGYKIQFVEMLFQRFPTIKVSICLIYSTTEKSKS